MQRKRQPDLARTTRRHRLGASPPAVLLFAVFASFVIVVIVAVPAIAEDWWQVGGAQRNFSVPAVELASSWPAGGPAVVWDQALGAGYSGIAVSGDRLFTMLRQGDEEIVTARRTSDGGELWSQRHKAPITGFFDLQHGQGPHVTPLIIDDLVITAGIWGDLRAYEGESGRQVWAHELWRELGGTQLNRGYASNPVRFGTTIIVPVGGKGQGLMALDYRTGVLIWKAEDFEPSYSSPLLIRLGEQDQLVYFSRDGVIGLDPATGRRLWIHEHPTSYGLNISMPLWSPEDRLLFVSSAYNGGSRVLRLDSRDGKTVPVQLWAHKQMRIHIGDAVRIGDVVWGSNGDFGAVPFTGVKIQDGSIVFRTREVARAYVVAIGQEKLLILDEDGVLALAAPRPDGLDFLAKHQLFDSKTWTPPTVVGKRVYARDQKRLVALDLP